MMALKHVQSIFGVPLSLLLHIASHPGFHTVFASLLLSLSKSACIFLPGQISIGQGFWPFPWKLSSTTAMEGVCEIPRWFSDKESACQYRRHTRCEFDPSVRKIPWWRKWKPTPVFLPRKVHGQRSQVGSSPRSLKELDTAEHCMHVWLQELYIQTPGFQIPVWKLDGRPWESSFTWTCLCFLKFSLSGICLPWGVCEH